MRTRRWLTAPLAGLILLALPAVAAAHSDIATSIPAAGANLDEPPAAVIVTFDAELDPASGFSVTDHLDEVVGAGELDLDVAERNVLRGDVEISEPGVYIVSWTAVAPDGHEETGSFAFGYRADPEDDAASHDGGSATTPDTALPAAAGPSWLALAGLGLVAIAVGLGVRRASLSAEART